MHIRLQLGLGEEPKRYYSTLPGPLRGREREGTSSSRRKEESSQGGGGGGVKHSLYQSPHLLLLQGFNRQVRVLTKIRPLVCLIFVTFFAFCVAGLPGVSAEQRAAHGRSGDSISSSQHLPLLPRHPAAPLPLTPSPRAPSPRQQQQQRRRAGGESTILRCSRGRAQCHSPGELFPLRALHHAAAR